METVPVGMVEGLGTRVGVPEPVMSTAELESLIRQKLQALPFFVERTGVSKSLPVYSDFKNGRTRQLTIVSHVYGDIDALAAIIKEKIEGAKKVEVKASMNRIVMKGRVVQDVKLLLTDFGF